MSTPNDDEKEKKLSIYERLGLPVTLLRDFALFGLIVVLIALGVALTIRVATQPIVVPQFSFDQFLNLVLAFFAIGLSIFLYLKASEVADKFYDNTYQFTKDISEKLGRMDEKYGEKIQGVQDLMKHWPRGHYDENEKKEEKENKEAEVERLKQELDKTQKEQQARIDELLQRAQLEEEEKVKYQDEFHNSSRRETELEHNINLLEARIRQLQNQSWHSNPDVSANEIYKLLSRAPIGGLKRLIDPDPGLQRIKPGSVFEPDDMNKLFKLGLIDREGDLTDVGQSLVFDWVMRRMP